VRQPYAPPNVMDDNFFGSMTDFDGHVGEGEVMPEEGGGIFTYLIATFVIFSIAFAVVRTQYN